MVSPLKKIILRLSLALCLASPAAGFLHYVKAVAGDAMYVRVAILRDVSRMRLKITGSFELSDAASGKIFYRGKNLNTTVLAYKDYISFGAVKSKARKIFIRTYDPDIIIINGRIFRGDLQLLRDGRASFEVINKIELEDYVKGILYHEVSHYWPQEALKSQAVISRTYAVYEAQRNKAKDYDLTSDIYSQVYGGKTSERYRTNAAVDETRGQIVVYRGRPIPTYYHATCAGMTEDASVLWNIDIPPLKGVECNFCKDSPHFNWHYVLPLEELESELKDSGHAFTGITDIKVVSRNISGRAVQVKLSAGEKAVSISAKDLRNIIGPNRIKSTKFSVEIKGSDAVFEGSGWGHGVGLCQWGAYFMAKQGKNYGEILKYYYPGTEISVLN